MVDRPSRSVPTVPSGVPHASRQEQQRYERLSPFELTSRLGELATHRDPHLMLRAGRGNPNWIVTSPREAFFELGRFAVLESRRTWAEGHLGAMPTADGIAARFGSHLARLDAGDGAALLRFALEQGPGLSGRSPDAWIHELVDAVLGDHYPSPPRMLPGIEAVVRRHLAAELYQPDGVDPDVEVFAVEGATAAMCDVFETVVANRLLRPGDRIAVGCPVFTPYRDIPRLPRYSFDVAELLAVEVDDAVGHTWQYPDEEIDRLADPTVRALFLVNPSNPPSVAMRPESMERLAHVVETRNPSLLVITDDVYGPFVEDYRSIFSRLPRNTIGVYSFSKLWGATGWRLGSIAIHRDNVFDELLALLPEDVQDVLARRYGSISLDPAAMTLMERLVADSRQVALNHTAGLSTPQQAQMALFALAGLSAAGPVIRAQVREVLDERLEELYAGLEVPILPIEHRAGYYVELDLLHWARQRYGDAFGDWVEGRYEPVDLVFRLAEEEAVVLLAGSGFGAPPWSVRVSLANLDAVSYRAIGEAVRRVGLAYLEEFVAAGGRLVEDR